MYSIPLYFCYEAHSINVLELELVFLFDMNSSFRRGVLEQHAAVRRVHVRAAFSRGAAARAALSPDAPLTPSPPARIRIALALRPATHSATNNADFGLIAYAYMNE